jgi:hypothetical protein
VKKTICYSDRTGDVSVIHQKLAAVVFLNYCTAFISRTWRNRW